MRLFLFFVLSGLFVGCGGGSDLPELASVSGTVTKGGQPLSGAMVTFAPQGEGRPSSGTTDDQGLYTLMYNIDAEGATLGMHNVTVEAADSEEDYQEADDVPEGQEQQTLQEKPLEVEVKAGANTVDIPL